MGYMRHHAIIVTGAHEEWIRIARDVALGFFPREQVSSILGPMTNNYETFCISPDGSKEGWEESDIGDKRREKFIQWLEGQRYEDHSSPLDWVCVQYGDDDKKTEIVDHSDRI